MNKSESTAAASFAKRLEGVRRMARHLREPEPCLYHIAEIEQLAAEESGAGAARLIDLLLWYAEVDMEFNRAYELYCSATGHGYERQDLYGQLARLAHWALRALGQAASEALLRAYSQSFVHPDARWLLMLNIACVAKREDIRFAAFYKEVGDEEGSSARQMVNLLEAQRRPADADVGV
jgi:hypothetical protein